MIQTYSQQNLKGLVDFRNQSYHEVFNAFVTTQEKEGMRGSRNTAKLPLELLTLICF